MSAIADKPIFWTDAEHFRWVHGKRLFEDEWYDRIDAAIMCSFSRLDQLTPAARVVALEAELLGNEVRNELGRIDPILDLPF